MYIGANSNVDTDRNGVTYRNRDEHSNDHKRTYISPNEYCYSDKNPDTNVDGNIYAYTKVDGNIYSYTNAIADLCNA